MTKVIEEMYNLEQGIYNIHHEKDLISIPYNINTKVIA